MGTIYRMTCHSMLVKENVFSHPKPADTGNANFTWSAGVIGEACGRSVLTFAVFAHSFSDGTVIAAPARLSPPEPAPIPHLPAQAGLREKGGEPTKLRPHGLGSLAP